MKKISTRSGQKARSTQKASVPAVAKARTRRAAPEVSSSQADLNRLRAAVDGVTSAIMVVDRDFVVTFVNEATRTMLARHAHAFQQAWPGFRPEAIVGSCIDQFHRNPAHQRRLLAEPKNLPYRAEISVGSLRFSLLVSGVFEGAEYVGNVLEWSDITSQTIQRNQLRSIDSLAVIEFEMDGRIITANENFLTAAGYTLEEIRGKHHGMFVDPVELASTAYRQFWEKLGRGEAEGGQYLRRRKDGSNLWLQASYNPIADVNGRPCKVVKYATDITASKLREADQSNQLASVSRFQAVIEFKMDGTVVTANENFLAATGYTLEEIRGKHHSMFCQPAYRQSIEYRQFWEKLGRGEADSRQYPRVRKDGREIWLQAIYAPIADATGKAYKVVKFATDITQVKEAEQATERALAESGRVIRAMASGDLVENMQGEFQGEFASLRDALNGCVNNLRDTVTQIRGASGIISTSAEEIARGNTDLSSRTEEQAASIAGTASSMEELTGTVKQNAENAQQANQLAGSAREQAELGGAVVENAIAAMAAINESSKRISDIIGVIDEIAFQTNLLALNAAVEAARAGEQGRGFAVVAAEVRNLAQRSAGAAKEIKSLIKDSGAKVDEGSRLVNDSGATLRQIVQAVKKVSDIIAEIADASAEQATGIDRIGTAISQMDQAVQQNAALVEQAAAAAASMAEQSRKMDGLVAFFQTGEPAAHEGRPVARVPVPASPARRAAPSGGAAARPSTAGRGTPVAALAEAAAGKWEEF